MRTIRMIRPAIVCAVVTAVSLPANAARRKEVEAQQRELDVLKQYVAEARDSLQREMADRWRAKQRYVEQREIDKEELARLKERQEQAFSELSRVKEEVFAKERILEDSKEEVERTREEWDYVVANFEEVLDKEAEKLPEAAPLEMERRRKALEELRRNYRLEKNPRRLLPRVVDYYRGLVESGGTVSAVKRVVMPDEGDPREMSVVRFGDFIAYAVSDEGEPYVIRQTGKLGPARYTIEEVGSPELAAFVTSAVPEWSSSGTIDGPVRMDVMQNANSGLLISGKKVKAGARIVSWFHSGGPVMIPLALLCVWALVLVVLKLVQFRRKHRSNRDLFDKVAGMLAQGKHEEAQSFAGKRKGVVARVVTTCLEHRQWNRGAAEKAVRELLVDESPQLNKHLTTLAVIAGAAPLLGLLGTVTGMIRLFEVITHYGTGDPKILAGGISEALVTTQTGLAIAIPILLLHNYLRNRTEHIESEMEKHAIRILNRLWPETT